MTIYVLIACSKSKLVSPSKELCWGPDFNIGSWVIVWNNQPRLHPSHLLYTGRSFKQQLQLARQFTNVSLHIISAGAGLLSIGDEIPSYEATFRKEAGPKTNQWHNLPHGGLSRLEINPQDSVVSFAPPQYHRALMHDPFLDQISDALIVASTSPLASKARTVLNIHPRSKEVLKVSSTDLNTKFLEIFLNDGVEGFNSLYGKAKSLPPMVDRKPVSDEELYSIVKKIKNITSNSALVRHLRDDLLIKASVERINAARKKVIQESQDG